MGVEARPFGVRCNIRCRYCYQNPERDAGNVLHNYDLDKIKRALDREGREFTLFGGEPLLMRVEDLEELWSYGFERFGANNIQTNGTLIEDRHIRLFHKYNVRVGVSVDGPGDLNDVRWAGSLERTRRATAKTHETIERLCKERISTSLIVTLHRCNATGDKLPRMHDWIRHLDEIGVNSLRLHLLEVDDESVRESFALSSEELLEAMLSFLELEQKLPNLRFDVFRDMRNLLAGNDRSVTCIWNACDPYTTRAVRGVEGNGQRSNCGRTNKDGIDFVKSDVEGLERYLALYQTPQEFGGCKGCRFFLMCKGQCPGTAIAGDWRNRTEHCELLMALYRHLEEQMLDDAVLPVSAQPIRRQLEQGALDAWARGRTVTIAYLNEQMQGKEPEAVPDESRASSGGDSQVATEASAQACFGLQLLGFQLPDFARLSWVGDRAREVWEPRLRRISAAWAEIEWRTVAEGLRRCGVTMVSPEDLPTRAGEFARLGLGTLPVELQGVSSYTYANASAKPALGDPFQYRVVVGATPQLAEFQAAWDRADQGVIGELLGYPSCCREFFRTVWVDHGLRDTTWPMAFRTASPDDSARHIEVSGPPLANILWRWMGVRAVAHLPCRFDCEATVSIGQAFVELGRKVGFDVEMDWLLEILGWPVEWSCLHGVAEIKTPLLKVSTSSDATATKYVVRWKGQSLPEEAARGLTFPYGKLRAEGVAAW